MFFLKSSYKNYYFQKGEISDSLTAKINSVIRKVIKDYSIYHIVVVTLIQLFEVFSDYNAQEICAISGDVRFLILKQQ